MDSRKTKIQILFALVLLPAVLLSCSHDGGGGGGGPTGGTSGGKLVGGDGVFSDTYYNSALDFAMTVPEEWKIYSSGNFSNGDNTVTGTIESTGRSPNLSFNNDVDALQAALSSTASSYTEVNNTSIIIDQEPARIIEFTLTPPGSGVVLHEIRVYIDKNTLIAIITFKTPDAVWTSTIEGTIQDIIEEITTQNSLAGGLRRTLNQAEYGIEKGDEWYYLEQFAASAFPEMSTINPGLPSFSKAEFYDAVRNGQILWIWDIYRIEMEWWNMRNISQQGMFAVCNIDLTMNTYDSSGNLIPSRSATVVDRVTFHHEDGVWKICGEDNGALKWGINY